MMTVIATWKVGVNYLNWIICEYQWSLHPWNKFNLVMMHDPSYVLLDFVCYHLVENFCIYIQQYNVSLFCSIFVEFWYQSSGVLVEWVSENSSSSPFQSNLKKIFTTLFFFLPVLSVIPLSSTVLSRTFVC